MRGIFHGPAGVASLAPCQALASCTALDLTHNYLGDEGAAALLRSPYLSKLKVLRLARNQLTDAGIIAVRELYDALLDHVQLLDLSGNRLTRRGLGVLDTVRGHRAVRLETADNVQSAASGDAPVAVSDIMPEVMQGVAEAARLKHRVAHPAGGE
jgi:hypothetical protein